MSTMPMPSVPMPSPEMTVGRQGHYAGAASRLVAFAADVGASWGLYLLGQTLLSWAWRLITGHTYTLTNHRLVAYVVLGIWWFVYFTYQWAVSGKTLGMAIFGVQVVTTQGGPVTPRQALLRTVGLDDFVFRWGNRLVGRRRKIADWPVGPPLLVEPKVTT